MSLFRNALAITLIIMTVMIVLSQIGINIGPLIAGAGVVGLAIARALALSPKLIVAIARMRRSAMLYDASIRPSRTQ